MWPSNIYASASTLILTVETNFSPNWSVDSNSDFVTFQIGSPNDMAAFGFGSASIGE